MGKEKDLESHTKKLKLKLLFLGALIWILIPQSFVAYVLHH